MTDWNERYRQGEHLRDEPHPLVLQFAAPLSPGHALDIACGAGRHAVWLAQRGWRVTAVDSSAVAIELVQQRALDVGATVDVRLADLERHDFIIEPQTYDLIVVCNYLQRDLFPSIREGTVTGGIVIAAVAMIDDDPNLKPMNPSYLLRPGELRAYFAGWDLLRDFEGKPGDNQRRAMAEMVARRGNGAL